MFPIYPNSCSTPVGGAMLHSPRPCSMQDRLQEQAEAMTPPGVDGADGADGAPAVWVRLRVAEGLHRIASPWMHSHIRPGGNLAAIFDFFPSSVYTLGFWQTVHKK